MNVELLAMTQNPIDVMYVAARTCYSPQTPTELYNRAIFDAKEKKLELVKKVLESGHQSIAEHVNFTFAIEEISRACSHQLVRHRLCTFSQQSQRYVEIKESFDTISELLENPKADNAEEYLLTVAQRYFTGVTNSNYRMYIQCLMSYLQAIKLGMKPEDARTFLPNATKTNIVVTTNLRNLIHVCGLRLCSRAQSEIREVFVKIKEAVKAAGGELYADFFDSLLQPQCLSIGYCPEKDCCGRAVPKAELIEGFNKYLLAEQEAEQAEKHEEVQKALDTIFSETTLASEAHKELGEHLEQTATDK